MEDLKIPEINSRVWKAIYKTINKFREQPYYFFTESDIHSYFYHAVYSSRLEVAKGNRRISLVHREYPTNFRYHKKELANPHYEPFSPEEKNGDRGNYDIAVLNPQFISEAKGIEDVVNKNVGLVIPRLTNPQRFKEELLFAIEFKYMISNSKKFVEEIQMDNKKLEFAKQWGTIEAVNLVFCNIDEFSRVKDAKAAVISADKINSIFIQAYYKNGEKAPPILPIDNEAGRLWTRIRKSGKT